MNFEQIRNGIVDGLKEHLQKPVILMEQTAKKPNYPFIGYKFTTPYSPNSNRGIRANSSVASQDPKYDYDIEESLIKQVGMTISINAYGKNTLEAQDLAKAAHDYFRWAGYEYLKAMGIVVVSLGAFQDRSVLIVDYYERRIGFDVTIRVVDRITRKLGTIEKVDIEGGKR